MQIEPQKKEQTLGDKLKMGLLLGAIIGIPAFALKEVVQIFKKDRWGAIVEGILQADIIAMGFLAVAGIAYKTHHILTGKPPEKKTPVESGTVTQQAPQPDQAQIPTKSWVAAEQAKTEPAAGTQVTR